MKKKQKLKERICALVLALAMVLTWVLPDAGMTVQAAAGDAKKVTLKFKDAAEETRGIGALTLKLQSNDDPSYEKKKEIEVKAGETSKEIELKEGVEYNYEVEKTGYETTKDGRFTVEAEKADIDILLTMSEITLLPTTDSVSLKVGETYDISVTNPVQELAYTWSTTDGNVASVENGKVTAKGEGSADISVTNGVKTKTVSVNVSKNQINGFSMTVKEPSGDDQSSVILTAKGLPADVSGNVIFYDVTGGQKTLLYKAEAAATVEYTYETDSLLGAKQFEAVYSGNEKYEGATATATGSYGKTQAITIDGDVSKEVTYGTEHWNDEIVIALADIENTLKGRTLATEVAFAQSEDAPNTGLAENVAVVRVEADHTIHVIPKNAGKVTIKIKAVPGEGNFYREASVDYTLTVKRQEVSFENVTWNKASKVYDGNTGIELTGTVNTEKITIPKEKAAIAGSDVAVNEQNEAQPQNVTVAAGIYYMTVEGNGTENYQLVVEEGQNVVQNAATITHRPLYLTSANAETVSLAYGQNLKTAIEEMTGLVALCNGNGVVPEEVQGVNSLETGLVGNDQITVLPGATAPETLHVNEAAYKVIVPNITNENKISENYEFKFIEEDDYKGDLKVTKQTLNKEDLLKKIDLKGTTNGIYGVKNGADELEKVWVSIGGKDELGEKKGTPVLKMNVKATQYYDEVYMSVDNGNSYVNVSDESDESQNILEQLKPEEGIQDKVVENVKVYLKNSEDKSGNTVTEVTNLTDWLHIDNEAPRAVIKDYDTTKYSDAFESLSFNMFKNEIYTAEISVSDTSGDSVEGSGLHNTTTQKYCVYEMGTDETALKLDKDAVKSIIEKVDSGQEQSWSKLEFDKNGKDEITVGKAKDKEAAENNYLILVKTIDNTGNEAVYASNGIVVDVTSPKVECTFDTSKDGGYVSEKDGILCYQGDAKYELKIEDPEEYFSSISKLEVIVSKDGETITPTTKEFDADETYEDSYIIEWPTSESGFSYEELKNKSSIVVKGVVSANKGTINGVGTNKSKIKIKAYDTAGNVSETIEQQLAFDTKAPEISVSFENKNGDPITQKDEFSYYQDTTVMVIKYTDRNFPVGEEYKDNLYFILKREEDDQERKVMLEGLEKEGITYEIEDEEGKNSFENYTDNRVVTVKLTFDDQDKYEIKPYCVDMFGNEGTTEETYKFAVDTEAPVIEYTYEYLDADNKWKPLNDENAVKLKNAPIRVNVTVTEHFFSLKDNFVFEEKGGENTQVKTALTAKEAVGKIPNYQEQADTWTAASSDDHPVGWTHNGDEHRIGFVFENDANYTFKLDYTDLSGRSKNTGDLKFTVDKTSPSGKILVDGTENWYAEFWNTITFNIFKDDNYNVTIAVTYDLNTPLNERYYKDVRTATVVVTERNFDESAVRFNITNTDGTQPAISGWTHSANAGVSDDATHTCQVTFAADGDYTFTLETTDLAGNASSYNRVDDFTIDRTVPTIQVSYDNNSAATPGYFNANRTATVTVNEHNFNAAEVNAQITAALQGSGVAAPGLGGWSTNGDVHTASVTFSADADYTFDVDYTDLAGNAAADYTQDKFTVDKTDPEVEFFDIEDKSANNGTVAPGVKYSDVNYMESGVDITIKGAKHDKTELSGNRTNIANGESIKMEDFKHDEETDDVYTMTAVIKDKAGNETEKEVMFSVNRFGSNYIFSETTEKFLDDVYANKPKDLVVTEVNVDSLVFNGISYGLDGTKKELKAGSDYTVKQSGGEGSWKEYTYTIKKENFEKEGRYSVTIDSEDKATNKMNNKVKECNIDFVIDKTPPTVVITGIEESSYRADEREMTINLSDNTAVKCVDVIIDGKSVATYAQKEIEKAGGKISYMIEGASEPQKIEAAALDMAGNETTSEMHKVLVTSSVWIQYINNTPLLIGSILGIVLVAGGLIWFFVIRKKKEESK